MSHETDVSQILEIFKIQGFVVIPNALRREQVEALNKATDEDLNQYPEEWIRHNESVAETVDILSRTDAFDHTIEHPVILPLLREILGKGVTFEEYEVMLRIPSERKVDLKSWHRDLTRDYSRRGEIEAVSVIYYLSDVSETDSCFSIIPGTHESRLDLRPEDVQDGEEVDINGPAGTALIFHARCIHAGKLKQDSVMRRTLHIYYEKAGRPRTSEWTPIPERLYSKPQPAQAPLLYSKWDTREVFEGVGKRPADLAKNISTAEAVKLVQARALTELAAGQL